MHKLVRVVGTAVTKMANRMLLLYLLFFLSAAMLQSTKVGSKRVVCIRHSITEMNEYLATPEGKWGSEGFVDPLFWDTRLSENGINLAKRKNNNIKTSPLSKKAFSQIDLIVASPLTRAITTSDLILSNDVVPSAVKRLALPEAREWLFLSSDVGRYKAEMSEEFPAWDFSLLDNDKAWWYTQPQTSSREDETVEQIFDFRGDTEKLYGYKNEPLDYFINRIIQLKHWLRNRQETTIALVAHYGTLKTLTGKDFENAEVHEVNPDEFLSDDDINKQANIIWNF